MPLRTILPLLFIFIIGSIFAEKLTNTREFNGKIEVQIFKKRKNTSKWELQDRLNVPNAKFPFQFGGLDSKNNIMATTKYDFIGITDQGDRVVVRMKDPATVHYNPTNGSATLEMNLRVEDSGVSTQLPIKL